MKNFSVLSIILLQVFIVTIAFPEIGEVGQCGTQEALEAFRRGVKLPRASNGPKYVYSTHFIVHFDTTGTNATTRAYAESTSKYAEYCWAKQCDTLLWAQPPPDYGYGGDNRYDIYILNLASGILGLTYAEYLYNNPYPDGSTSYIEVDNNITPWGTLQYTVAHEFAHASQLRYSYLEGTWFMENCATWISDVCYDNVNYYIGYLNSTPDPLDSTHFGIDNTTGLYEYGGATWPMFLQENHSIHCPRYAWEKMGIRTNQNTLSGIDSTLIVYYSSNLQNALIKYAVWRYFTGTRADTIYHFKESNLWPTSLVLATHNTYPASGNQGSRPPDGPGGTDFIRFNPGTGGLTITFDGQNGYDWGAFAIGYRVPAQSQEQVISLNANDSGSILMSWTGNNHIALIPAVTYWTGSANNLTFTYNAVQQTIIQDVGVTRIISPTGTNDSGNVVTPQARVKNFGTSSATFPVSFRIGSFYTNSQNVSSLAAGDSTIVSFAICTLRLRGTHTTRCTTALTGDQNTANDTLSGSVTVRVRDISVTAIEVPIGTIDSGTVVLPRARVRNNGTSAETFPISFRIGSFYNSTPRTKTLNSGVEDTVIFSSWTALQRGTWSTKCTTALSGDQILSNNSLTGSVTVRVIDAACLNILAPTGTIDSGTVIKPVAQLRNNGTSSATFSVTFRIGAFYTNTRNKTLGSGITDTVGFNNWTAIQIGTHTTKCTTALTGDMVLTNDALTGSVTVQVGVLPDVGVTQIIAPTGTVDSGTTVTPQAMVKNFGNTQQSFPVSFRIGSFYNNTQNINNLNPGDSTVVSFTDWIALPRGTHPTKCTTALTGDINPNNNALSGSVTVTVQMTDVGVTQISAPTGTIDSGTVVTPQAKVRNYGNNPATFPVTFRIGSFYTNTQPVNNLGSGDSTVVSFSLCTLLLRDTHITRCTTALTGDQNTANDALSGSIFILASDIGVSQIIAPVGSVSIGTTVTPSARISNFGVNIETFPVYFRIISSTDTVYSDDTIITIPADQDSVIDFTTWTALSGSYRSFVRTILAGDQISNNDTASRNFSVSEIGWQTMTNIPSAPSGKYPKNGTCITGLNNNVYLLKANNTSDFFIYTPNSGTGSWTTLTAIPLGTKETGDGKNPKKGAAITGFNNKVYILRGNNTPGYWSFDTDPTVGWQKLSNLPTGAKNPKGGSKLTYVRTATDDCIFAMKGSKTTEFYLYSIAGGAWQLTASPGTGISGKPGYKEGSCLTYDGDSLVYVLKNNYGDFCRYNTLTNTWAELRRLDPAAYLNREGKKKKVKDGAGLVYVNGAIYLMKGGNTYEFWKYDIGTNNWSQMNPADIWDIPTGSGKKVKSGGSLCLLDNNFYAVKGNNTPEFYKHNPPITALAVKPAISEGPMELNNSLTINNVILSIKPNPAKNLVTVTYNQPNPKPVNLKLYNISGSLVKSYYSAESKNGFYQIDVQNLTQGVYILRLNSGETEITRKLVIEK